MAVQHSTLSPDFVNRDDIVTTMTYPPIGRHRKTTTLVKIVFCLWLLLFEHADAQTYVTQWAPPHPINDHCCAAYPVPVADPWGQLHLLWADADGYIWYAKRTDEVWTQPIEIIANPGHNPAAGLDATVDGNGRLHLIWRDGGTGGALYYASAPVQYAGNARFWREPVELAPKALGAALAASGDGTIYVAYTPFEAGQSFVLISSENGTEWSQPVPAPAQLGSNFTGGSYVSMVIDPLGVIHVAWNSQHYPAGYPEHAVFYQHSSDRGLTWSDPYDPDPLPPEVETNSESSFKNKMLKVAVGPQGDVHLTWHQYTGYRFHRWSDDGGNTWREKDALFPDMGAAYNGPVDMAFDSSGRMHVVASRAAIWYRTWSVDGQWTPPELIDPTPADWHHHRVAVVGGNQVHLFYPDINETGILWTTYKTVDAPVLAPLPLPTLTTQENVSAPITPDVRQPDLPVTRTPVITSTRLPDALLHATSTPNPWSLWLWAFAPVILLIGSVFIMQLTRRR